MMPPFLAITFGPLEIAFAVIAGLSLIFIILFLLSKDPATETPKLVDQPKPEPVKEMKEEDADIEPPEGEQDATEEDEEEAVPALLVEKDDDAVKLPEVPDLPEPKLPPLKNPTIPPLPDKKPVADKSDEPEMKVEISPFVKKQGKDLPPKPGAGSIEDEADHQTIEEEREA